MKLSTSDESAIVVAIAEILDEAKVSPSGRPLFAKGRDAATSIKPQIGSELHDRIADTCGELGLYDFVRHSLTRELLALDLKRGRRNLSSVEGYEDNLRTAKRLLEKLRESPQKIEVISPLPLSYSGILLNGVDELQLGDGVSIKSAEKAVGDLSREFASRNLRQNILRSVDLEKFPTVGTHFFCTWHTAFVGGFVGNPALQAHQDKLRSLHGCLLALGVVEEDFWFDRHSQYAILGADNSSSEGGSIVIADKVDTDLSYFYENFDVTLPFFKEPETSEDADHDDDGEANFEKEWALLDEDEKRLQKNTIEDVKKIFRKDDHSRKLITSSLSLFRSFVSSKSLDIILESTIALEVLLGDRNEASGIGLTKLLANRCAYLLGDSDESRRSLMEEFKSIYEIRSGIVHSGLHQTGSKASKASEGARDLAGRVLRKELDIAAG